MAPTGYTVASAATLLGAKPPRRREIEDVYFAQMAAADQQNREQSHLQRTPEVRRKDGEKKVRFSPSTVSTSATTGANSNAGTKAVLKEDEEDAIADEGFQAVELVTRAGTSGVAASFTPSASTSTPGPASGPSSYASHNTDRLRNGKATGSPGRQGPKEAAAAPHAPATSPASKEGRAATQTSTLPALPFAPSHRLNAKSHALHPTGRIHIDTSAAGQTDDDTTARCDGVGGGHTASTPSSSSSSRPRGRQPDDIFFTPIDVNRSTIDFTFFPAPMSPTRVLGSDDSLGRGDSSRSSHSPLLHRAKEPQDQHPPASRPSQDGRSGRRPGSVATARKEKITVSAEKLDRLIVALANAPLVQTHLRKQWLEEEEAEQGDKPSMLSLRSALRQTDPSDSTPSLTNNSTASDAPSDSSSNLYRQANSTFINQTHAASFSEDDDQPQTSPEHPLARTRPRATFGGIALTDPKVHGAPIRFISKGYRKGANVLQVGQCSFLNVPYGASVDCILRVEPGDIANGGAACSVTIQVMAPVLERRKGRKVYLLVAEVDVTESLTKAALVELARHTGMSLEDIEVVRPEPARHDSFRESVDWCALADELHACGSTNDVLAAAARGFAALDAATCSMQTLTLLSELERIKAQHVDFLVLRAAARAHGNGMPTGIAVPWISQHLDRHVDRWSPAASSLFREDLAAAVGRRHMDGEPFAVRVLWGRKKKIVRCVPLLEGDDGKTAGWVAFVGDEFDL